MQDPRFRPSEPTTDRHFSCQCCDARLPIGRSEVHHLVPDGNHRTIRICVSCHDRIDRMNLADWGLGAVSALVADWGKISVDTRLFLLKAIAFFTRELGRDAVVIVREDVE